MSMVFDCVCGWEDLGGAAESVCVVFRWGCRL